MVQCQFFIDPPYCMVLSACIASRCTIYDYTACAHTKYHIFHFHFHYVASAIQHQNSFSRMMTVCFHGSISFRQRLSHSTLTLSYHRTFQVNKYTCYFMIFNSFYASSIHVAFAVQTIFHLTLFVIEVS